MGSLPGDDPEAAETDEITRLRTISGGGEEKHVPDWQKVRDALIAMALEGNDAVDRYGDVITDRGVCMRFLKAHKGNVHKAVDAFKAHLEWRVEYGFDNIVTEDFDDLKKFKELESGLRSGADWPNTRLNLMVDLAGMGYNNVDQEMYRELQPILVNNYPKVRKVLYVYPLNWFVEIIWNAILRPILVGVQPDIEDKLCPLTGDWKAALKERFHPSQLERRDGGFLDLSSRKQPRQKKGLEPKRYSELLSVSEALGGEESDDLYTDAYSQQNDSADESEVLPEENEGLGCLPVENEGGECTPFVPQLQRWEAFGGPRGRQEMEPLAPDSAQEAQGSQADKGDEEAGLPMGAGAEDGCKPPIPPMALLLSGGSAAVQVIGGDVVPGRTQAESDTETSDVDTRLSAASVVAGRVRALAAGLTRTGESLQGAGGAQQLVGQLSAVQQDITRVGKVVEDARRRVRTQGLVGESGAWKMDKLNDLVRMLDRGLLTQDEFVQLKAEVMQQNVAGVGRIKPRGRGRGRESEDMRPARSRAPGSSTTDEEDLDLSSCSDSPDSTELDDDGACARGQASRFSASADASAAAAEEESSIWGMWRPGSKEERVWNAGVEKEAALARARRPATALAEARAPLAWRKFLSEAPDCVELPRENSGSDHAAYLPHAESFKLGEMLGAAMLGSPAKKKRDKTRLFSDLLHQEVLRQQADGEGPAPGDPGEGSPGITVAPAAPTAG